MSRIDGDERLLTVEEIAERLQVKPSWVYSHKEELGVHHLGKYLRFSWTDVQDRLKKLGPQDKAASQIQHRKVAP
jgi:hypothetical protein